MPNMHQISYYLFIVPLYYTHLQLQRLQHTHIDTHNLIMPINILKESRHTIYIIPVMIYLLTCPRRKRRERKKKWHQVVELKLQLCYKFIIYSTIDPHIPENSLFSWEKAIFPDWSFQLSHQSILQSISSWCLFCHHRYATILLSLSDTFFVAIQVSNDAGLGI